MNYILNTSQQELVEGLLEYIDIHKIDLKMCTTDSIYSVAEICNDVIECHPAIDRALFAEWLQNRYGKPVKGGYKMLYIHTTRTK